MKKDDSANSNSGPVVGQLSESLEDYIEIIYMLIEQNKVARVRDIAKAKDVKMSSVVSAIKRLDSEGLVKHEAREFIELTPAGANLAKRLLKRHNFLTRFLVEALQIDPKIAETDACSMEHSISLETMTKLYDFAEFLQSRSFEIENIVEDFKKYCCDKYSN
ncbi:MAG: metal-dependent transcriptional regulator [candidate division Zixibacteria bacterium]|nr:metal-dependent transcriptional regulator [candidate division Zixibacteria bacterium]